MSIWFLSPLFFPFGIRVLALLCRELECSPLGEGNSDVCHPSAVAAPVALHRLTLWHQAYKEQVFYGKEKASRAKGLAKHILHFDLFLIRDFWPIQKFKFISCHPQSIPLRSLMKYPALHLHYKFPHTGFC